MHALHLHVLESFVLLCRCVVVLWSCCVTGSEDQLYVWISWFSFVMGRRKIPDLTCGGKDKEEAVDATSKKAKLAIAKASLPDQGDAAVKFEDHVWQMWLRNSVSAKFVGSLAKTATAAGAKGVGSLGGIGRGGALPKNMSRDLKVLAKKKGRHPPVVLCLDPCLG